MTTTEYRQGSEAWLLARLKGIGSSDAPVVCGESPYKSAIELWAEKTGRKPPEEPDEKTAALFRIGKAMEPVLLGLYREMTGRKTRREPRLLRHRDWPWMLTSLDARVVGEGPRRIVECKWTHARRWSGEEVPGDVMVQVQHAMEVAGAEVCDVVALVGPNLRIVEVQKDSRLIRTILGLEERFWRDVTEDTEPSPDGSESARRALISLHPQEQEDMIREDPIIRDIVSDILSGQRRIKWLTAEIDTLKNSLRYLLRDHEGAEGVGSLGDAYRVSYRKVADATEVNWVGIASAYRNILADLDNPPDFEAIEGLYTTTVPGSRRLVVTERKIT